MTIVLRSVKGSALTVAELDGNFTDLDGRVDSIETTPPQPNEITNFSVVGSQLTVFMQDGNSFGPFTLPTAVLRWRGEFVEGASYFIMDMFTVTGIGIFVTLADHVTTVDSNGLFDPDLEVAGQPAYQKLFGQPVIDSIDSILDVEFDSGGVAEGDVLVWRGQWVNETPPPPIVQNITGNIFNPNISHADKYLRFTSPAGCTVNLPNDGNVPYRRGTELHFRQSSEGPVLIDSSSAVTVNGVAGFEYFTAGEGALVTVKKVDDDEWDMFGYLAEQTS